MKKTVVIGIFSLFGAVSGAIEPAGAATAQNIATHGAICNPYNAGQALDIDYLTSGVRNINAATRPVICSVPRHPVTGPSQSFYVDGSNSTGATTCCAIYSYDFNGTFLGSMSNCTSSPTFDTLLSLPSVPTWAYTAVLCQMPGNGAGVLFGVTAVDN